MRMNIDNYRLEDTLVPGDPSRDRFRVNTPVHDLVVFQSESLHVDTLGVGYLGTISFGQSRNSKVGGPAYSNNI